MEKANQSGVREHVVNFIQKFRVVLFIVLGALVACVIGAIAYEEISKSTIASQTAYVERLEATYEAYLGAKDDAEKSKLQADFEAVVSEAGMAFKGKFAEQRALFLNGTAQYNRKAFAESEASFVAAAAVLPASYLSPICLMNAAFAAEDAGSADKALAHLGDVVAKYPTDTAQVPRALFNIGRINEAGKKWAEAGMAYQKIVDGFAASNWTKLAKDRIIYLKSQKLI